MKTLKHLLSIIIFSVLISSCATIIGGSKYYAHVKVSDHPNAKISYNGVYQGAGQATILVKRNDADNLSLVVKEEGLDEQTFNYTQNSFRGWAFVGTVLGWTGLYNGIPLPWGIVVDFATGSLVKPNTNEKGITKMNYKNYIYNLDYKGVK